jgi:type IV secretory pathway TrbD component
MYISGFGLETRVIIKTLKKMIAHMKPKVVFIGTKHFKKNQNG